jgi:hypothetical protein
MTIELIAYVSAQSSALALLQVRVCASGLIDRAQRLCNVRRVVSVDVQTRALRNGANALREPTCVLDAAHVG